MKKEDFPEEGDFVVCTVHNVKSFGAFVLLDEYDGKEGFIHVAEVSPGWIKYIRDFIRERQKVVCKVLKVNPEKGHIDLSLKQVNEHQRREKIHQWKDSQKAEKLLELVANKLGKPIEECYSEFGEKLIDAYGSLYRAFEEALVNKKSLTKKGFKGGWVQAFMEVAADNIVPPYVTIGGQLEIECPLPDGVLHVRDSLLKAESSEDADVVVQYIGAPRYRITVKSTDYKSAEEELEKAVERAVKHISKCGGTGTFHREESR